MTEYAPSAIQHLFEVVQSGISAAVMGGILGDKAHTYGYHRGRNYVSSSDYSVQLAQDKKGDGEAASALDISWSKTGPQYDVSKRLLNAKHDSRCTKVLREFYGSTDGINVIGWDYQGGYSVTSDDSHLWHIHISILREYANDFSVLAPVADVILGYESNEGEDSVPFRMQVKRDEAVDIKGGNVTELKFNVEDWDTGNVFFGKDKPGKGEKGARADIGGPEGSSYTSTFSCQIDGVPAGKEIHTALAWCDSDTGETIGQNIWQDIMCEGGTVNIIDTRVGWSGAGKGVKVRIKTDTDATIKADATWSVIHW